MIDWFLGVGKKYTQKHHFLIEKAIQNKLINSSYFWVIIRDAYACNVVDKVLSN